MRPLRILLCVLMIALPLPAAANGWEHWGIPLDVLMAAVQGGQPDYQVAAARSLGFRKETAAVEPLLKLAGARDVPIPVASTAIEALGRIGDARALPPLQQVVRADPREEVRAAAATALGLMPAPENLDLLLAALSGDAAVVVRSAAVEALGAYDDPRAVAALAGIVTDPRQHGLRLRAIRALGASGRAGAAPLLQALEASRSDGERAEIIEAIGQTGSPEATRPLARVLQGTRNPGLRLRLAVALGAIRDGSAAPTLIELLQDESVPVRVFAVRGLADSGDVRAAEPLRRIVREVAARHAAVSEEQILTAPAPVLARETVRREALSALVAIDPAGSFAEFAAALPRREFPRDSSLGLRLNEGEYERRRIAMLGLGYGKSPAAAELLRGPLTDPDFRLRAAAVRAFGILGRVDQSPTVIAQLRDDHPEVRWEAAFVLGRLGDPRAETALQATLNDPHEEVRTQAALSLSYLGARGAVPELQRLSVSDGSGRVRAAADSALTSLGAR